MFNNVLNFNNEINSLPRYNFKKLYEGLDDFIINYRNIFVDSFYFLELKNLNEKPIIKSYLTFKLPLGNINISQLFFEYLKSPQNSINTNIFPNKKMLSLPRILIINLENAKQGQKIDEEIKDFTQYVLTDIRPNKYNLFAVISKTIKNGNDFYIAYVKKNNNWISIKDGEINECKYENINQEKPTVLFYKGC